ncbi:MAG: FKBP-type peptidyl-prolyl cis-trans isomerase [Myxococcota bacterium]
MILRTAVAAALLVAPVAFAQTTPTTAVEKVFYLYGLGFGMNLDSMHLEPAEVELVVAGLRDGYSGAPPKVIPGENEDPIEKLNSIVRDRARAATRSFLAEQKNASGAQIHPSGLIMTEIVAGTGAQPTSTQTVKVHYHGTLPDGSVFDSSVERGTPAEFPLNRVIECWTEGLGKMKVGGKSRLVCPPEIAYGDRGSPGRIPPGSALVFEIELLGISEAP